MSTIVQTAVERRVARVWTPLGVVLIVAGWVLAAAIEGGALHV